MIEFRQIKTSLRGRGSAKRAMRPVNPRHGCRLGGRAPWRRIKENRTVKRRLSRAPQRKKINPRLIPAWLPPLLAETGDGALLQPSPGRSRRGALEAVSR